MHMHTHKHMHTCTHKHMHMTCNSFVSFCWCAAKKECFLPFVSHVAWVLKNILV